MQTREKKFSVKTIIENTESGNIVYDHPMQRKPGQWDREQQSLLIHSMVVGYAVPQAYALQLFDNFDDAFSVLDGKQRFTTVCEYIADCFRLTKDLPTVTIRKRETVTEEDGTRRAKFITKEYDISGKLFSELDSKIQDIIIDFDFSVVLLSDFTDEDIENQFYRLNNGTALTKDQKTRVLLGDELAEFLDTQEQKPFLASKTYFPPNQRKQGAVQTCILQTLMLIMDYSFKDFGTNSAMDFAEWFRANHKKSDLDYCSDIFDKLNEAFPDGIKPHKLMKKTNIPIIAYHIQTADEVGMDIKEYGRKILEFFDSDVCKPKGEYAELCGAGAYKKEKVQARVAYVDQIVRS